MKRARYLGKVYKAHSEMEDERLHSNKKCTDCARVKAHLKSRQYNKDLKIQLSGKCALCGVDDYEVLCFDHVYSDGYKEQGGLRGKRTKMYHTARKLGLATGKYRVLCFNCNMKAHYHFQRTGLPLLDRPDYTPIKTLQREVTAWADQVYPDRSLDSIKLKLREEAQELLDKPFDALEFGDVVICLLDLASRTGVDVYDATARKIKVNSRRKWVINPKTGVMRHRKETI